MKLLNENTRLTLCEESSLITRRRFTRFTLITSGGGYSKSVGYKRTFKLVPVYLSVSFPTFIHYLQNRFFKSLAVIIILRPF